MMSKLTVYKIILVTSFLSVPVYAAEPQPRLVSVTGEGEVLTVPDEVQLNLQVESFDEKLAKAKEDNDAAVKGVLSIVKRYNVADKDFRTDVFTVRNDERYYFDAQTNQQKSRRGYFVTKNVSATLRDISKF